MLVVIRVFYALCSSNHDWLIEEKIYLMDVKICW